ncbi:M48 family metallopeptidase [bacterium]|nr:M48 family metallopeptidase [bacterium]
MLLTVDPADGVILFAPRTASLAQVEQLVRKRASWILDAKAEFARIIVPPTRRYVSGESFIYLGRYYALEVIRRSAPRRVPVLFERGRLVVSLPRELTGVAQAKHVRSLLVGWFRNRAGIQARRRVERFAREVGVPIPAVLIRDQLKRWGSCDKKRNIRLNWRIVMAPASVFDYLCAHEVCHLVQPDHSPEFWRTLATIMPDYENRRERLRVYGPMFDLSPVVEKNG